MFFRELEMLCNDIKKLAYRVSEGVKFYTPLILFLLLVVVAISYTSYIKNFLNQFLGYIIFLIIIFFIFANKYIDKYLEKKQKEEEERKRKEWLKNVEPIHRNIPGRPPIDDWVIRRKEVYNQAGGKCATCGIQLYKAFHVHHKIPVAKGGHHSFENLELLCEKCHSSAHGGRDFNFDNNINEENSFVRKISILRKAIESNHMIQFKYTNHDGRKSIRTINPQEFVNIENSLCVHGYCCLRKQRRTFAIKRMDELQHVSSPQKCYYLN